MTAQANRKTAFYLIAILIPVAFLVIIELLLRAVNYGQPIPAFIPVENTPGYLQPNPNIIERYFASPEMAPKVSPDTVYFKAAKPNDTFRIVIQGGSTAAGFPFGRFGSLQGMLQQRFKNAYPDKDIEIINTAMAAVNTYTLLDLQDEIIELKPDLVLVYTGHNEYLGVLGAASVLGGKGSRAATLAYLKFKSFRLFQLIESLTVGLFASNANANSNETSKAESERTTMAKAAQGQRIPLNSELYQAGLHQFKENLSTLLQSYQKAGVPVLIGNLVSIENQLAPFSKGDAEQQTYKKGQALLSSGQTQQAQQLFIQAKDLDQLRFRAPSDFNQIVKQVSSDTDAELVDVEKMFRKNAPNGILDKSLFLEHVHPTPKGYFLLGEAFYDAVKTRLGEPSSNPSQSIFTQKQAQQWMPLSEVDIRYGNEKIRGLTNGYPFTDEPKKLTAPKPLDPEGVILLKRLQGMPWLEVQKSLVSIYQQQNDLKSGALMLGIIADAVVNSAEAQNSAAQLFRQINQTRFAFYHQKRAMDLVDPQHKDYERYAMNYAFDLFLAQRYEESLELLKSVRIKTKSPKRVDFFIEKVSAALNKQSPK